MVAEKNRFSNVYHLLCGDYDFFILSLYSETRMVVLVCTRIVSSYRQKGNMFIFLEENSLYYTKKEKFIFT